MLMSQIKRKLVFHDSVQKHDKSSARTAVAPDLQTAKDFTLFYCDHYWTFHLQESLQTSSHIETWKSLVRKPKVMGFKTIMAILRNATAFPIQSLSPSPSLSKEKLATNDRAIGIIMPCKAEIKPNEKRLQHVAKGQLPQTHIFIHGSQLLSMLWNSSILLISEILNTDQFSELSRKDSCKLTETTMKPSNTNFQIVLTCSKKTSQ